MSTKEYSYIYDHPNVMGKSLVSASAFFAPQLALKNVLAGITFYESAFGAIERRRWSNPDHSVHVAEMEIDGAVFHMHEEVSRTGEYSPETLKGITAIMGIFVSDPDTLFKKALSAGAKELSTMQDYDYGYRQGKVMDPFGHHWLIEKRI